MTAKILFTARLAPALNFSRITPDLAEARTLVALAAPMTGAALVNMGMSITDTVMMGWMGPTALAAGAVVSDIYSIVFYFAAGILSIMSPMVARAMGANCPDEARRALQHGFAAALIVAVPAFGAVWHAGDIVGLFDVSATANTIGRDYAHAMAFAIVPMLFVAVWRNQFDAIGRPRVYLVAVLAALPLNALANWVLMFGWSPIPAFGLAGAGIASALVALGLMTGLAVFGRVSADIRRLSLQGSGWRIDRKSLTDVFRLGLPIGLFTIGEVGIFLLATVVVSPFGIDALAAHAITIRIAGVIYALPTGLSQATTVRVGRAIGRADRNGLKRSIRSARIVGMVSGAMIFAGLLLGSGLLADLFLDDARAVIAGAVADLLVLLGILNFAQGFVAPATGIFRGFKETRTPMLLCLIGYWLIGMPIACAGAFHFGYGVYGIWTGLASGVAATALLMNLRLVRPAFQSGIPAPRSGRNL